MQLLLDPLFLLFNKHKSILIGELYYRNSFEILYIVYMQLLLNPLFLPFKKYKSIVTDEWY